jgi:hypothetical protein
VSGWRLGRFWRVQSAPILFGEAWKPQSPGTLLPTSTDGTGRKRWRFEKHRSTDRALCCYQRYIFHGRERAVLVSAIYQKGQRTK